VQVIRIALLFLFLGRTLLALDPNKTITQYAHTAWRIQEGHVPPAMLSLGQTTDGYLWIGTQSGLFRFDGVRFVPWTAPAGSNLPDQRVYGLLGARDGSLWIGTGAGLAQWKDGKLKVLAKEGRFGALLEDHHGVIWAGHTRRASIAGLCRIESSTLRCFGNGTPPYIQSLYEDTNGSLWAGGDRFCRWDEGRGCVDLVGGLSELRGYNVVDAVAGDSEGVTWADVYPAGLGQILHGKWQRFANSGATPLVGPTLLLDRDGGFWIGTADRGLIRRFRGSVDTFIRADGLSGDHVDRLFEDREGNIWAITGSGLDRFRDVRVATLGSREGLSTDQTEAVTADRDGSVWIASPRGYLDHLRQGRVESYPVEVGARRGEVTSLFDDSQGRLWVGLDFGLLRRGDDRFFAVAMPDGSDLGMITRMEEDRDHNLWIATINPAHPLVRVQGTRVAEVIPPNQLSGQLVDVICADPNGGVWLGLKDGGLMLYRNGPVYRYTRADGLGNGSFSSVFFNSDGMWVLTELGLSHRNGRRFETLSLSNGLPCDGLDAAIEDNDGALWLKMSCGYARISRPELRAWLDHRTDRIHVPLLDSLDGAQGGQTPFSPKAAKSADGRLWFTTESVTQVIDPKRMPENRVPPPVHIEALKVDGKSLPLNAGLTLAPHANDIEIDYTALSLSIPERVFFRYRLDGADTDWQDVGTRRQAFYNHLGPGRYRFRVIACNNDGVWNDAGVSWTFAIAPAFYQTRWFLSLCVLACAGMIWSLYRLRLQRITRQVTMRYRERLVERTRIARELHDTLLQSLAGVSLQLGGIAKRIPLAPDAAISQVESIREQVDCCFRDARLKVWDLRSPALEDRGLPGALGELLRQIEPAAKVPCELTVTGRQCSYNLDIEEQLLRIAQEGVNNAVRHARARSIRVLIAYEDHGLRLQIADDGQGFDPELAFRKSGHWGLKNMRERAEEIGAAWKIKTVVGHGTEIEVSLPPTGAQRGAHG
jgi:signal transduction histidine kinase/ligand-binding sensor domain-containing protein